MDEVIKLLQDAKYLGLVFETFRDKTPKAVTQSIKEVFANINQAITILEKPVDIFEIRIPNLRQEEIPFVKEIITKVTKSLLNTLMLRRAAKHN